jgi:hypothetical protein
MIVDTNIEQSNTQTQTQIQTTNPSPNPMRRIRNQRRQQACSFCRSPGHNIIRCNDDRLTDFEALCVNQMRVFETLNSDMQQNLQNWLIETRVTNSENQHLLKSFAIKKCRAVSTSDILSCVILIAQYIHTTYSLRRNIYVNHRNGQNIIIGQNNIQQDLIELIHENNNNNNDNNLQNNQTNEINTQINLLNQDIAREMLYVLVYQNSVNRYLEEQNNQNNQNKKYNISLLLDTNNDIKDGTNDCNICYENKEKSAFIKFNCQHEFCKECVVQCLKTDRRAEPCCALCRAEIKTCKTISKPIYDELLKIIV